MGPFIVPTVARKRTRQKPQCSHRAKWIIVDNHSLHWNYSHPQGFRFRQLLARCPLSRDLADRVTTTGLCHRLSFIIPHRSYYSFFPSEMGNHHHCQYSVIRNCQDLCCMWFFPLWRPIEIGWNFTVNGKKPFLVLCSMNRFMWWKLRWTMLNIFNVEYFQNNSIVFELTLFSELPQRFQSNHSIMTTFSLDTKEDFLLRHVPLRTTTASTKQIHS